MGNIVANIIAAVIVALGTVLVACIGGAVYGLLVMWLWNALFVYYPVLGTALPEIGFFQAWGLSILCGILFKSSSSK